MAVDIPDKLFFRIGEVSKLTDIKPHVLRYWESEFRLLHPVKSNSGQRVYRRRDVETVLRIKELLYTHRYTIEGAKKKLREMAARRGERGTERRRVEAGRVLADVKRDLHSILRILDTGGHRKVS